MQAQRICARVAVAAGIMMFAAASGACSPDDRNERPEESQPPPGYTPVPMADEFKGPPRAFIGDVEVPPILSQNWGPIHADIHEPQTVDWSAKPAGRRLVIKSSVAPEQIWLSANNTVDANGIPDDRSDLFVACRPNDPHCSLERTVGASILTISNGSPRFSVVFATWLVDHGGEEWPVETQMSWAFRAE